MSTTLPVEVRFVAADHSLLSPARGRNVCYIGVSTQPNANEVYSRVEPILKDFGGRPHWGKHFSMKRNEVEAMYPDSFDKFRQIDSTTTRIHSGAGLGLYIVKTFVELLSGTISVQSWVGEGSVFTVHLPVNVEDILAQADSDPLIAPGNSLN